MYLLKSPTPTERALEMILSVYRQFLNFSYSSTTAWHFICFDSNLKWRYYKIDYIELSLYRVTENNLHRRAKI